MSTDGEGLGKQPESGHPEPLSSGAKAADEMRRLADQLVEIARRDGIMPGTPTWDWVQESQQVQYRIADSIEETYAQVDAYRSTTRIEVARLAAARRELGQTQAEMQAMIAQMIGRPAGTGAGPGGWLGILGRLHHLTAPKRAVLVALLLVVPVSFGFYVGHVRTELAFATLLVRRVLECARAPSLDQETGKAYCPLDALTGL